MEDHSIFVIDDDPQICRILNRIGKGLGVPTRTFSEPRLFLNALNETDPPSVIALDLGLPDLDGVKLLRRLAKLECPARIFLISGVDSKIITSTQRYGRELGLTMAGVFTKPFDIRCVRDAFRKGLKASAKTTVLHGDSFGVTKEALAEAIATDQITVVYQPKIDLRTGNICGAEALVRWMHPVQGTIYPDQFIPSAETSGSIDALTFLVLEKAIMDCKSWSGSGVQIPVSVNLSPSLLVDPRLPERILNIVNAYSFDPGNLILEITEAAATQDIAQSMEILNRLCLGCVRLSIDDFGTGFSSLKRLVQLPYSEIKIDKSFIMEIGEDSECETIVRVIVDLARSMGLSLVAEGVEKTETLNWLIRTGCDVGQGYLFCKPLSGPDFSAWLSDNVFCGSKSSSISA